MDVFFFLSECRFEAGRESSVFDLLDVRLFPFPQLVKNVWRRVWQLHSRWAPGKRRTVRGRSCNFAGVCAHVALVAQMVDEGGEKLIDHGGPASNVRLLLSEPCRRCHEHYIMSAQAYSDQTTK